MVRAEPILTLRKTRKLRGAPETLGAPLLSIILKM